MKLDLHTLHRYKLTFMQNLSQTQVLGVTLLTFFVVMTLQCVIFLGWNVEGSLFNTLALNRYLFISFFVSLLSGLFVYQALMNRIQTRDLTTKVSQLHRLIENLVGTTYQQVIDTYKVGVDDISANTLKAGDTEIADNLNTEQLVHVTRFNALGEMASGLAHEINQPLAAISLFSQAGKRLIDSGDYSRVSDVFDKLSQQVQRAGAIIERVQSMAVPHKSKKQPINCYSLITDVTQLAQAEAKTYGIEIQISIARKLPAVMVDVVQIQQVILNLLRNSMQAMSMIECGNGNKIDLKVRLKNSTTFEIAIGDSGGGISKTVETSLFQPFMTTKETGIGMGLATSRAIIEGHSGSINFYNNKNNGATFYFTLPTIKRDN